MTPDPTGPDRHDRRRRTAARTAGVAFVGIVVALAGLVQLVRPLATPVQDCGTAAGFLLHGRPNLYVDPADPPKGVTAAEAEANNALPCQERAANRARPAATAIVVGCLVAVAALLLEWLLRLRWARADRREPPAPAVDPRGPPDAAPGTAPTPGSAPEA